MSRQSDSSFVLSRDEVRAIDQAAMQELGIPGLLLMENAARGAAEVLKSAGCGGRIVIVCGPGNNGGDGLALARQLAAEGLETDVFLVTGGRRLSPDAAANLQYLERAGLSVASAADGRSETLLESLTDADWIVDALLGTGVRGGLRAPFDGWAAAINASAARVLAIDVPSGLDCDTGTAGSGCVTADVTVTFVGEKAAFRNPDARRCIGELHVAPIGIPQVWTARWLQRYRDGARNG